MVERERGSTGGQDDVAVLQATGHIGDILYSI